VVRSLLARSSYLQHGSRNFCGTFRDSLSARNVGAQTCLYHVIVFSLSGRFCMRCPDSLINVTTRKRLISAVIDGAAHLEGKNSVVSGNSPDRTGDPSSLQCSHGMDDRIHLFPHILGAQACLVLRHRHTQRKLCMRCSDSLIRSPCSNTQNQSSSQLRAASGGFSFSTFLPR
jgi:hypothetical protein